MYRTVVTICTAQWSLYVPHSGHYMYRTVVTICTASLTFSNSTFCPHTVFMCFVWISKQTAIISLYSINWLVCVTETVCLPRGTDWVLHIVRGLLTAKECLRSQVGPYQTCVQMTVARCFSELNMEHSWNAPCSTLSACFSDQKDKRPTYGILHKCRNAVSRRAVT